MASATQFKGLGRAAPLPSKRQTSKLHFASRRAATVRIVCQQASDQQTAVTSPDAAAPTVAVPVPPAYPVPVPVPHGGIEGSTSVYAPPPGYTYQVPSRPGQEYYLPAPPGYYAAPPPPVLQEANSGLPWFVWFGAGILGANIFNKIQEYMKNPKSPQQIMTEMAMKQMMGSMSKGGSPFPGGMPPFPGGMPGMPGGFPPTGFPQPPAAGSTVDVASTPSSSSGSPAENGNGSLRKGEKFASRYGQSSPGPSTTTTPPSSSTSNDDGTAKPASNMDVVEPIVREPASSSSSSQSSRKSSSSFFADAASQSQAKSSSSSSSSANGNASSKSDGSVMMEMMETMLRNPDMQKMLYPYLPEPMRNPQSIEWMLNNPEGEHWKRVRYTSMPHILRYNIPYPPYLSKAVEVKKQMAETFEQQNMMSPQMMEMMRNMNINQDQVNRQFQELGMKPEDVIQKLMANPEVAAGFQNPKVQAAIMDISQNPMNIVKYQSDPEIMKVLNHVSGLFENDIKMK